MSQDIDTQARTVFAIDDEPGVLEAVARLIRANGVTVETFPSAARFLARPPHEGIGCVLVDLSMPELDGLALQARLSAAELHHPIIFMSGRGDVPSATFAMKAGAVDFLVKPVDEGRLMEAIAAALAASAAAHERRIADQDLQRRFDALTPCEKKVCILVSAGRLNKQIAGELSTSEKTTKRHRGRVMAKLGVRSVADLVRLVDRIPMVDQPGIAPLATPRQTAH
jgi:FixJ family two-component response regulator